MYYTIVLLGRVAVCTTKAAFSRHTFPVTVCMSVYLSSALWKNGGSDPDAIGMVGRTGPWMRQVVV